MDKLRQAALEYYLRKQKIKHPKGEWLSSKESKRRVEVPFSWWPHNSERKSCCDKVKQPTVPNGARSLQRHCRSIIHIAQLMNVDEKELRKKVREIKNLCSQCTENIIRITNGWKKCSGGHLGNWNDCGFKDREEVYKNAKDNVGNGRSFEDR